MKEVYDYLHDEYILSFEEMKVEKDNLEKYLIIFYFGINEIINKTKYKNCLKFIEDKIEDESLDIDFIFEVLDKIKLEFEIDEELFVKKKAFLYIYSVYYNYYKYLKD